MKNISRAVNILAVTIKVSEVISRVKCKILIKNFIK